MQSRRTDDPGRVKLQELMLAMAPGEKVSVRRASEISGLDPIGSERVLDALVRAGLMVRLEHDAYVRCRLEIPK